MENAYSDRSVNEIPETLRLPLSVLYKFGLLSANKFKKYFPVTILSLVLTNIIVMYMVQYVNIKNNIFDFLRNLEGIFSLMQVLGKILLVTHSIDDFLQLIETTKQFWNPNKCSQQIPTKISSIYNVTYRLQRTYLLLLIFSNIIIVTAALLEKTLVVGIWTLEGYDMLYYSVISQQIVIFPAAAIFLWGLDCMYLGSCVEIIVQFRILCHYLEESTAEGNSRDEMEVSYLNKIKTCVRHHQLLLWFIKKFRQTFSSILLLQYVTVCPLVCAEIFAAFESHSFQNNLRHSIIFVALLLQLSFYCIPADHVADEALAIANAVYFSKWYSYHFPSLTIPLLLIMQNSQNGFVIKAGGLVSINSETVVNVLKVAWSACSLARGLKQN